MSKNTSKRNEEKLRIYLSKQGKEVPKVKKKEKKA